MNFLRVTFCCILLVGTCCVAEAGRLPDFSWDTVPRYMHVRKATAFTPQEIEYLATFPLITFDFVPESVLNWIFDLGNIEDEPFNDQFAIVGYEFQSLVVSNLGSLLLFMFMMPIVTILSMLILKAESMITRYYNNLASIEIT